MNEYNFNIKISAGKEELVNISGFRFPKDGIMFLLGESGIGKTLISKAIFGLLKDSDLEVTVNDLPYNEYLKLKLQQDLSKRGFFLFQEPSSHLNPMLTLSEQLNEGSLNSPELDDPVLSRLWQNDSTSEGYKKLLNVYPKPYRPSGGEKQRMLAAMLLKKIELFNPESGENYNLFVFDEPSGNLDNYYRDLMVDYIFELYTEKQITSLFITHDYSLISRVTEKYNSIIDKIYFRELIKKDKLQLRDFKPSEYLGWVEDQRLKSRKTETNRAKYPVLRLGSGIDVFGRKLGFASNNIDRNLTSLQLYPGRITYLKAPSGLGKTTVAKIITGLLKSEKFNLKIGELELNETTPQAYWKKNIWGKRVSLVFQHADESLNLNAKVKEAFNGLPLQNELTIKEIQEFLYYNFELNPTETFLSKKIRYLSGGQKQKINLGRSFLLDTDILILDEPINGMDLHSIKSFIKLLEKKRNEGKAILLISHNEEIFDAIVHPRDIIYLKSIG